MFNLCTCTNRRSQKPSTRMLMKCLKYRRLWQWFLVAHYYGEYHQDRLIQQRYTHTHTHTVMFMCRGLKAQIHQHMALSEKSVKQTDDFLKSEVHYCLKVWGWCNYSFLSKCLMLIKTAFICLKYSKNFFIVKYLNWIVFYLNVI